MGKTKGYKSPVSKPAYAQHLNELYSKQFDGNWMGFKEKFSHITTGKVLWNLYQKRSIGSYMQRKNVVEFNVGYGDWIKQNSSTPK